MLKHVLIAAASFLMVSLSACSSSNDGATTGDDQDIKEGHVCGGIAGIKCNKGLVCELSSNNPDASGKCVKAPAAGTLGGTCGGIAGIQCGAGLVCDMGSSGPPPGTMGMPAPPGSSTGGPPPGAMGMPVDQSGTCVKDTSGGAAEGEACGGFAGIQCKTGLYCKASGECCDLPGVCTTKISHPPPGTMGMPILPP
jgi:hypothetical protein